jgi:hypothetical protein
MMSIRVTYIYVERTNYTNILLTKHYGDTNNVFFIDCSISESGECSALLEGKSNTSFVKSKS